MNASSLLKKHVKYCREWTLKNANFVKSRGEEGVAKCLEEGDLSALCILPNYLQKFALYYGMKGSLAVIDGDDGGWAAIDRSISYSYWRVAVAAGVTFFRLNRGDTDFLRLYHDVPLAASLFCYALVHDLEEWRRNLWSILTRAIVTPGAITTNYWRDQGAYELFVLQCFNQEMPDSLKTALPELLRDHDLGSYQAVLDRWNDPLALEVALQDICTYHCVNLVQKSARCDPWPAFTDPPFDLVPYEIHAIKKRRDRLGLEVPTVDHPLLVTALAARETATLTPYCDEVTERVQQLLTLLT